MFYTSILTDAETSNLTQENVETPKADVHYFSPSANRLSIYWPGNCHIGYSCMQLFTNTVLAIHKNCPCTPVIGSNMQTLTKLSSSWSSKEAGWHKWKDTKNTSALKLLFSSLFQNLYYCRYNTCILYLFFNFSFRAPRHRN